MTLPGLCLRRPVLATVMSILIVILGIAGLTRNRWTGSPGFEFTIVNDPGSDRHEQLPLVRALLDFQSTFTYTMAIGPVLL